MTARDVLAEIEQRVDRMTAPDPTGRRRYAMSELGHIAPDTYLTEADRAAGDFDCIAHITADLRSLVAALRAVLDLHQPVLHQPGHGCAPTIWCSASDGQLYPCATVRAITEALNGVTSGTDR